MSSCRTANVHCLAAPRASAGAAEFKQAPPGEVSAAAGTAVAAQPPAAIAGAGAAEASPQPALPSGTPVDVTSATFSSFDRKLTACVHHYEGMLYVWVGGAEAAAAAAEAAAPPSQPNLSVAYPPRSLSSSRIPATSTVVFGGDSIPQAASSVAANLATWAKQPVFLTWALLPSGVELGVGIVDDAVTAVKAAVEGV